MKLLIRTITLATIGFFMILICLHATIVETVKHELEVANTSALNRTLDAWERNRELLMKGETSNLYFESNEDLYWFFYDSLAVQLNGKINIIVMANAVDLDNGILDVDTTATYMGLDRKERSYTVHADTYGKIDKWLDNSPERQELLKNLSAIPIGATVIWGEDLAGNPIEWTMFNPDDGNSIALMYKGNVEDVDGSNNFPYTTSSNLKYEDSEFYRLGANAIKDLSTEYRNRIATKSMTGLNVTQYGVYNSDVSYSPAVTQAYVPSKEEIENSGLASSFIGCWTRTAASNDSAYIAGSDTPVSIAENHCVRLIVNVDKNHIIKMEDEPTGVENVFKYKIDVEE